MDFQRQNSGTLLLTLPSLNEFRKLGITANCSKPNRGILISQTLELFDQTSQ